MNGQTQANISNTRLSGGKLSDEIGTKFQTFPRLETIIMSQPVSPSDTSISAQSKFSKAITYAVERIRPPKSVPN
jgi:hypothetical protein